MQLIQPSNKMARAGTNSKLLLHTLSPLPGHEYSQAGSTGMPNGKHTKSISTTNILKPLDNYP